MHLLSRLANRTLKAKAWRGMRRWASATDHTAETQENLLMRIVRENRETVFGREHELMRVRSVADYQGRVPIRDYDDFVPYVEAIAAGQNGVLTADTVTRLLPTGGSTGGTKLIPHTGSLRSAFQRGIDPWLHSLFTQWPGVMNGRAYWQVTPPAGSSRTGAGLTGFEEDSQYLSSTARALTQHLLAVPDSVGHLESLDNFKYVTLRYLLACQDLTIISVWSPTFLEALLGSMDRWRESLLEDIHDGTLKMPDEVPGHIPERFGSLRVPRPKRARELERCLGSQTRPLAHVWPELRVISCWSDGSASEPARRLMERFPGAALQPKGLIATEAIITFPWRSAGQALAVTSHFFEFLDGSDRVHLAHELKQGQSYSVIVTTQGGLYRYRLRDLVYVTGRVGNCPTLDFLGKEELIVDLVGEKLHEAFVRAAVEQSCADLSIRPMFSLVAPSAPSPRAPGFTLFIQYDDLSESDRVICRRLAHRLDSALQHNYQYRYAREIGQLAQIRVATIDREINAMERFERHCRSRGQRLGRVKPVALHSDSDWGVAFVAGRS